MAQQSRDRPARKPKPRIKLIEYTPALRHDAPVGAGVVFSRLLADTMSDRRTGITKRSNLAWKHLANFLAAKAFAFEPPPDRKDRKARQH